MGLAALRGRLMEQVSALGRPAEDPLSAPSYLGLIGTAQRAQELSGQLLELYVQQAREAGHTWQEIGELLGVTRQAAFQRFGRPIDPRTGEPMDKTVTMTDAGERARKILEDVLGGRLDEARASFNDQVREALTDQVWGDGLATIAGLVGSFEAFAEGEPFVRRIGDHTVVDVPLRYEAGDMKGRVAFDADRKVAGLFILAPDTP